MKKLASFSLRILFISLVFLTLVWQNSFPVHADTTDDSENEITFSIDWHLDENILTLSWGEIENAVYYNVVIQSEDGEVPLSESMLAETSVTFDLEYGFSYSITLTACDSDDNILCDSVLQNIFLPDAVENITTCFQTKNRVLLSWTSVENASFYKVYRKKSSGTYKLIAETNDCRLIDTGLSEGTVYTYCIKAVFICDEIPICGLPAEIHYQNHSIVSTTHQKYSYTEMKTDIEELVAKFDGRVSYEILGKSADGRNIYCVILGNPDAKKSMLVVSTLHAREYMCSLLCMRQIEHYLETYNSSVSGEKIADVLDDIAIYYIPMANPDGVAISQYGIGAINSASLKKTLYKIKKGSTSTWKSNARGVDLNWNFNYKFKVRGVRGKENFSGPSANSEPETKAINSLILRLKNKKNLKGVVNYHAMGSIIFGGAPGSQALYQTTNKMFILAKNVTGYKNSALYVGSGGNGNLREYLVYTLKIPSITLEIGTVSCPLPISQFPSVWAANRNLVIREAILLKSR